MTLRVTSHAGPTPALFDEWAALHSAGRGATPFTSAAWAAAWLEHYGAERQMLLCAREGETLVGLAALVVGRRGPLRVADVLGIEPGDYWDVLAAPERREEIAAAMAGALRAKRGWDAFTLRCVPPDSPLPAALRAAGLQVLEHEATRAPAIELPADFDAYLAALSGSHRQNLRKHLRRLDGGEVVLREVGAGDDLRPALDRWQDFRRRQWEAAGKEIAEEHLSPRFHAFMLDCLGALLPAGQAMVWEFLVDGEVAGTYVNFADDEAFHWYLGGFDPAHTRLGLGKIAIGHGIRSSIEAGRRRFDFGRGAEDYKYWYGAEDRLLPAQVIAPAGPRGRLALAAARAALARRS